MLELLKLLKTVNRKLIRIFRLRVRPFHGMQTVGSFDFSSPDIHYGDRLFLLPSIYQMHNIGLKPYVNFKHDEIYELLLGISEEKLTSQSGLSIRLSNGLMYDKSPNSVRYICPRKLAYEYRFRRTPIAQIYYNFFKLQNYKDTIYELRARLLRHLDEVEEQNPQLINLYDSELFCLDSQSRIWLSRKAARGIYKQYYKDNGAKKYIIGLSPVIETGIPRLTLSFWQTALLVSRVDRFYTLDGFWAHLSVLMGKKPNITFRGTYTKHDRNFHERHMIKAF